MGFVCIVVSRYRLPILRAANHPPAKASSPGLSTLQLQGFRVHSMSGYDIVLLWTHGYISAVYTPRSKVPGQRAELFNSSRPDVLPSGVGPVYILTMARKFRLLHVLTNP